MRKSHLKLVQICLFALFFFGNLALLAGQFPKSMETSNLPQASADSSEYQLDNITSTQKIWGEYHNGVLYQRELNSLKAINLNNPTNPVLLDEITIDYDDFEEEHSKHEYYNGYSFSLSGNRLVLIQINKIEIYDCSNPSNLQKLGEYALSEVSKVFVHNNILLARGSSEDLSVIDISNPTNPTLSTTIPDLGLFRMVRASGSTFIFIIPSGIFSKDMLIMDFSDIDEPTEVLKMNIHHSPTDIIFTGDLIYTCTESSGPLFPEMELGFYLIDISDIDNIDSYHFNVIHEQIPGVPMFNNFLAPERMVIVGDYIYAKDESGVLVIKNNPDDFLNAENFVGETKFSDYMSLRSTNGYDYDIREIFAINSEIWIELGNGDLVRLDLGPTSSFDSDGEEWILVGGEYNPTVYASATVISVSAVAIGGIRGRKVRQLKRKQAQQPQQAPQSAEAPQAQHPYSAQPNQPTGSPQTGYNSAISNPNFINESILMNPNVPITNPSKFDSLLLKLQETWNSVSPDVKETLKSIMDEAKSTYQEYTDDKLDSFDADLANYIDGLTQIRKGELSDAQQKLTQLLSDSQQNEFDFLAQEAQNLIKFIHMQNNTQGGI